KHPEDGVNVPGRVLAARVRLATGDHQIFPHRQAFEDAAALRHQRDTPCCNHFWRFAADWLAANRDLAAPRRQEAHGHIHAGRFSGAVAPEQTEHAGLAELERNIAQNVAVAIEGVDMAKAERASGQDTPLVYADRQRPQPDYPRR